MRMSEETQRQINIKTTLIFALADIQEELVVDIISRLKKERVYRFDTKKNVNAIKHSTEVFRTELNTTFKDQFDKKVEFGVVTDELKEIIFKALRL